MNPIAGRFDLKLICMCRSTVLRISPQFKSTYFFQKSCSMRRRSDIKRRLKTYEIWICPKCNKKKLPNKLQLSLHSTIIVAWYLLKGISKWYHEMMQECMLLWSAAVMWVSPSASSSPLDFQLKGFRQVLWNKILVV